MCGLSTNPYYIQVFLATISTNKCNWCTELSETDLNWREDYFEWKTWNNLNQKVNTSQHRNSTDKNDC